MSISPGTHLGPYEIIAPLGAGGMGEVYRARDPRMGREVAIKVSGERFSDRFEREVRAVAALNHSNICHVYDVGPNYLVMELVEGATIAERIEAGAMPLEEALRIAHQIGDALEAAHDKGIIHRDLKPANIKLKPDGGVKVLDFGLAKMAEQAAAAGSAEESPTVAMGGTIAGQIMGTAAYMAPEQARGKAVDKRADIWAFGVVLYEMLTAKRMFDGETISDVLAGVLTREPDLTCVPVKARRLLQRCLQKDPKRRLRDIGDGWDLLDDVSADTTTKGGARWKIASGVLVVISAIALWAPWRAATPPVARPSTRLDLDLGPDISLGSGAGPAVVLSPDGTRLVFVSENADGVPRLLTRRLDQASAVQLPATEGAYGPFFSPDGQWVGFFAEGKLKKTRLDGGEPISLCDAPVGRGASWGEDGNIVADVETHLSQVPVEGGTPTPLTELRPGDVTHRWPHVLPGGKAVLFSVNGHFAFHEGSSIAVVTLKDRHMKILLEHAGMYPRYLPSGHLAYVSKGMLFAVPFDLERLEVLSKPVPLWEVSSNPTVGSAQLDFSPSGALVYRPSGTGTLRRLQLLDATGKTAPLWTEPAAYLNPRFSPDGSRIALTVNQESSTDVWIYDLQRDSKTRLTGGADFYSSPLWSPDGQFVVFQSMSGILWTRADGAGKPQPLIQSKTLLFPNSFSPNGARLVFTALLPGAAAEIRTVEVASKSGAIHTGEVQPFLKTRTFDTFATFSPDGRWLAYGNTEGGRSEVYVRGYPDNGTQVQVSNAGGTMPAWSRQELFYRTVDQRIMAARYTVEAGRFKVEKPQVWFGKKIADTGQGMNFDLAPDGKRLAVLMPAGSQEPQEAQHHVMLVLNFFDEVRRRLGQTK